MGWRIVKQLNGKLARFSDIVDNFTHANLSEEEAIEMCVVEFSFSIENAKTKVLSGLEDIKPYTTDEKGSGHDRWDDSIETIRIIHGKKEVDKIKKLCSS
jgi:hypothetical protein